MNEYLYRYVDRVFWGDDEIPDYRIYLVRCKVVKNTPKGKWIEEVPYAKKRFVLNDARKKYAYPTLNDAWESFVIRKKKQKQILEEQLDRVNTVLKLERPR